MLWAASTWQVSLRNNKNSFLPDLGREEESMARKVSFLWTLQALLSSSLFDPAGRGSWTCVVTGWGKQPMLTLCWEILWLWGRNGVGKLRLHSSSSLRHCAILLEHQFCLLWNEIVILDRWLGRLKDIVNAKASYSDKSHIRGLDKLFATRQNLYLSPLYFDFPDQWVFLSFFHPYACLLEILGRD